MPADLVIPNAEFPNIWSKLNLVAQIKIYLININYIK